MYLKKIFGLTKFVFVYFIECMWQSLIPTGTASGDVIVSDRDSRAVNHGLYMYIYMLSGCEWWLIPKISACRARIWSLVGSERSERVTNFIFCRAGWYFSLSIIFTFRWHVYHQFIKSKINTDTSIFLFSREKSHDSKYSK